MNVGTNPSFARAAHWLAALALFGLLVACAPMASAPPTPAAVGAAQQADPLASWNDGANKQRIVAFVRAVTTERGRDFVPVAERIAVFDNDGTLWSEQPIPFQLAFVFDRIRTLAPQHPEWKEKDPFKSLVAGDMRTVMASGERGLFELLLAAQSDITTEEFQVIVCDWLATARHPKFKRPYGELTFRPMQELMQFLRANGFRTYIVSGGSVEFIRAFAQQVYGIPPEQVIGSRQKLAYEVRNGQPAIVLMPQLDFTDDKEGKPIAIEMVIGRRPVAAFGNSDGDFQMLEWTMAGRGQRLAMIVHHDDAAREFAYDRESSIGQLARALDTATARGWSIISIKSDWADVYAPTK
jgi:phosphoglycolate phosphatase-like HAD superfamily hydrolase